MPRPPNAALALESHVQHQQQYPWPLIFNFCLTHSLPAKCTLTPALFASLNAYLASRSCPQIASLSKLQAAARRNLSGGKLRRMANQEGEWTEGFRGFQPEQEFKIEKNWKPKELERWLNSRVGQATVPASAEEGSSSSETVGGRVTRSMAKGSLAVDAVEGDEDEEELETFENIVCARRASRGAPRASRGTLPVSSDDGDGSMRDSRFRDSGLGDSFFVRRKPALVSSTPTYHQQEASRAIDSGRNERQVPGSFESENESPIAAARSQPNTLHIRHISPAVFGSSLASRAGARSPSAEVSSSPYNDHRSTGSGRVGLGAGLSIQEQEDELEQARQDVQQERARLEFGKETFAQELQESTARLREMAIGLIRHHEILTTWHQELADWRMRVMTERGLREEDGGDARVDRAPGRAV